MKLLTVIALCLSLNAMADSNTTLKSCVSKAVQVKQTEKAQDYIKAINSGIRDCRAQVKAVVAAERAEKKKMKNAARIEKLKLQLAKLTK